MKATIRIVRGNPMNTERERDGEKGGYQIKNKRSDRVTIATTHFTATIQLDSQLTTISQRQISSRASFFSFLSISGCSYRWHTNVIQRMDRSTYAHINVICQAKKQPRLFSFLKRKRALENSHARGGLHKNLT